MKPAIIGSIVTSAIWILVYGVIELRREPIVSDVVVILTTDKKQSIRLLIPISEAKKLLEDKEQNITGIQVKISHE